MCTHGIIIICAQIIIWWKVAYMYPLKVTFRGSIEVNRHLSRWSCEYKIKVCTVRDRLFSLKYGIPNWELFFVLWAKIIIWSIILLYNKQVLFLNFAYKIKENLSSDTVITVCTSVSFILCAQNKKNITWFILFYMNNLIPLTEPLSCVQTT